jgi:hypothetical protein
VIVTLHLRDFRSIRVNLPGLRRGASKIRVYGRWFYLRGQSYDRWVDDWKYDPDNPEYDEERS